jgi:hypothetical protein
VSNAIYPFDLAHLVFAVGYWFVFHPSDQEQGRPATVIWEAQGNGLDFGNRLWQIGYRQVHYYETTGTIDRKRTKKPGWYGTQDGKRSILTEFGRAAAASECVVRSLDTIEEMREFVWAPGGGVIHSRALNPVDGSGVSKNHGDRVSAAALAWKEIRGVSKANAPAIKSELPDHCPARRRKDWEREQQKVGQFNW